MEKGFADASDVAEVCQPKAEAPIAKNNEEKPRHSSGKTEGAQTQSKSSKDDSKTAELIQELTKRIDEQNQRLAAMETQTKVREEAAKESFWDKVKRNKVLIFVIAIVILIPLMVVVILLQLRTQSGMEVLASEVQRLKGQSSGP